MNFLTLRDKTLVWLNNFVCLGFLSREADELKIGQGGGDEEVGR